MKKTLILFFMIMFVNFGAFAATKNVAVMKIKAQGVSLKTAEAASTLLNNEIINSQRFTVIERQQLDKILQEQGLQQTGITDASHAAELGKLLNAEFIIIGELVRLDKKMVLTVRMVEVEKGISEYSVKKVIQSSKQLNRAVSSIVAELLAKMDYDADFKKRTMSGYYWRSIIPGWGQIYAGYVYKGSGLAVLNAGACSFMGWAITNSFLKSKAYGDLGPEASQIEFDQKYDEKKKAALMSWIGVGLFVGSYLLNWLDVAFFSQPDFGLQTSVKNFSQEYLVLDCQSSLESEDTKLFLGWAKRF